jgi:uncharacterized protein with HEPN domain
LSGYSRSSSEASRHIPEELRAEEQNIPWQRLADLGNWLRHACHRIDADILWNIAQNDLEPLERFVTRIIASENPK